MVFIKQLGGILLVIQVQLHYLHLIGQKLKNHYIFQLLMVLVMEVLISMLQMDPGVLVITQAQ